MEIDEEKLKGETRIKSFHLCNKMYYRVLIFLTDTLLLDKFILITHKKKKKKKKKINRCITIKQV